MASAIESTGSVVSVSGIERWIFIRLGLQNPLLAVLLVFLVFALYFIPSAIAINRKSNHKDSILLFNIWLGWTIIGWVAALYWSITDIAGDASIARRKKRQPKSWLYLFMYITGLVMVVSIFITGCMLVLLVGSIG